MSSEMPYRKYDISIHVCGDSTGVALDKLEAIVRQVVKYLKENPLEDGYSQSGTTHGGYTGEVKINKDQTNENYYRQLNEFLNQKKP